MESQDAPSVWEREPQTLLETTRWAVGGGGNGDRIDRHDSLRTPSSRLHNLLLSPQEKK